MRGKGAQAVERFQHRVAQNQWAASTCTGTSLSTQPPSPPQPTGPVHRCTVPNVHSLNDAFARTRPPPTRTRDARAPQRPGPSKGGGASTWCKVPLRPVFWPSGRVPSSLRARQCPPTTAPSGAVSGVPFFPHAFGVGCSCTPERPPTRREVLVSSDGVVRNTVVLSNEAS